MLTVGGCFFVFLSHHFSITSFFLQRECRNFRSALILWDAINVIALIKADDYLQGKNNCFWHSRTLHLMQNDFNYCCHCIQCYTIFFHSCFKCSPILFVHPSFLILLQSFILFIMFLVLSLFLLSIPWFESVSSCTEITT